MGWNCQASPWEVCFDGLCSSFWSLFSSVICVISFNFNSVFQYVISWEPSYTTGRIIPSKTTGTRACAVVWQNTSSSSQKQVGVPWFGLIIRTGYYPWFCRTSIGWWGWHWWWEENTKDKRDSQECESGWFAPLLLFDCSYYFRCMGCSHLTSFFKPSRVLFKQFMIRYSTPPPVTLQQIPVRTPRSRRVTPRSRSAG